ncbi:MAG: acyl transferase [Saprospiraceae bacterium]
MSFDLKRQSLLQRIANVRNKDFERLALEVYRFQATYNDTYREFHDYLGVNAAKVSYLTEIPFLPIQLFKTNTIQTGNWGAQVIFESSGTTGAIPSKHHIRDLSWYLVNATRGFESFYGDVADWNILALLPSYLERGSSSLVCMVDEFIHQSHSEDSGFFLNDYEDLFKKLVKAGEEGVPTLLIGVTYALLDMAEQYELPKFKNLMVMETGGMKGRRKEITRTEMHEILAAAFGKENIHSEYGMTELLSQAYSRGKGIFTPCKTMLVMTADVYDPLQVTFSNKRGVLQVIDLANLDTCSFIATEDLGFVHDNGDFEVIGRLDSSELRGCNLMVE